MINKIEEYKLLKYIKKNLDEYSKLVDDFAKNHALDKLPFIAYKSWVDVLNGYIRMIDEDKRQKIVKALEVPIYGIKQRFADETVQKGAIKEMQQVINSYLKDMEKELDIKPEQIKEAGVKKKTNTLKDAVEKVLDKYEEDKKTAKQNKEKKLLKDIFGNINN
ncbi:MAG: hypothetical protein ACLRFF_01255 [Alphaproteobacteria bacterium]